MHPHGSHQDFASQLFAAGGSGNWQADAVELSAADHAPINMSGSDIHLSGTEHSLAHLSLEARAASGLLASTSAAPSPSPQAQLSPEQQQRQEPMAQQQSDQRQQVHEQKGVAGQLPSVLADLGVTSVSSSMQATDGRLHVSSSAPQLYQPVQTSSHNVMHSSNNTVAGSSPSNTHHHHGNSTALQHHHASSSVFHPQSNVLTAPSPHHHQAITPRALRNGIHALRALEHPIAMELEDLSELGLATAGCYYPLQPGDPDSELSVYEVDMLLQASSASASDHQAPHSHGVSRLSSSSQHEYLTPGAWAWTGWGQQRQLSNGQIEGSAPAATNGEAGPSGVGGLGASAAGAGAGAAAAASGGRDSMDGAGSMPPRAMSAALTNIVDGLQLRPRPALPPPLQLPLQPLLPSVPAPGGGIGAAVGPGGQLYGAGRALRHMQLANVIARAGDDGGSGVSSSRSSYDAVHLTANGGCVVGQASGQLPTLPEDSPGMAWGLPTNPLQLGPRLPAHMPGHRSGAWAGPVMALMPSAQQAAHMQQQHQQQLSQQLSQHIAQQQQQQQPFALFRSGNGSSSGCANDTMPGLQHHHQQQQQVAGTPHSGQTPSLLFSRMTSAHSAEGMDSGPSDMEMGEGSGSPGDGSGSEDVQRNERLSRMLNSWLGPLPAAHSHGHAAGDLIDGSMPDGTAAQQQRSPRSHFQPSLAFLAPPIGLSLRKSESFASLISACLQRGNS